MALRDALTPAAFDKKFANRTIDISNPPVSSTLMAPVQLLPGNRVFIKNFKDYRDTRGNLKNVSNAYGGEQTVYVGGGQYCGFPLGETLSITAVRKELLKNYILGHKNFESWGGKMPPLVEFLIDYLPLDLEKGMPINSPSNINRNYR